MPGQLYLAVLRYKLASGEGESSEPVIVGLHNTALEKQAIVPTVGHVSINSGEYAATIAWNAPVQKMSYFRIYRADDSVAASNRYEPFTYDQPELTEYEPIDCIQCNGTTECYYQMAPYDSVLAPETTYTDIRPRPGACYWITGVDSLGLETPFSPVLPTEYIDSLSKDVVVIMGSTQDENDFAYQDSIIQYYERMLQGLTYDLFMWRDSNVVNCPSGYCVN